MIRDQERRLSLLRMALPPNGPAEQPTTLFKSEAAQDAIATPDKGPLVTADDEGKVEDSDRDASARVFEVINQLYEQIHALNAQIDTIWSEYSSFLNTKVQRKPLPYIPDLSFADIRPLVHKEIVYELPSPDQYLQQVDSQAQRSLLAELIQRQPGMNLDQLTNALETETVDQVDRDPQFAQYKNNGFKAKDVIRGRRDTWNTWTDSSINIRLDLIKALNDELRKIALMVGTRILEENKRQIQARDIAKRQMEQEDNAWEEKRLKLEQDVEARMQAIAAQRDSLYAQITEVNNAEIARRQAEDSRRLADYIATHDPEKTGKYSECKTVGEAIVIDEAERKRKQAEHDEQERQRIVAETYKSVEKNDPRFGKFLKKYPGAVVEQAPALGYRLTLGGMRYLVDGEINSSVNRVGGLFESPMVSVDDLQLHKVGDLGYIDPDGNIIKPENRADGYWSGLVPTPDNGNNQKQLEWRRLKSPKLLSGQLYEI